MMEDTTSREQHGQGVLILRDGEPIKAFGCLLSDGILTDADCLLRKRGDQVWARLLGSDPRIRRRGRLIVDPGVALHFIDESSADIPPATCDLRASLERDLARSHRIRFCVQSELFAGLLYAALCSVFWRHKTSGEIWSSSMRSAGGIVAGLRGEGDYLFWYCWGHEGTIDEVVLTELAELGWEPVSISGDDLAPG